MPSLSLSQVPNPCNCHSQYGVVEPSTTTKSEPPVFSNLNAVEVDVPNESRGELFSMVARVQCHENLNQ